MPRLKRFPSSVSSSQKSLVPPGGCTWWMLPPAARSRRGHSQGNPLSPAAPARERSIGSVGSTLVSVLRAGAKLPISSGHPRCTWRLWHPWLSSVLCFIQPWKLKINKNRAADRNMGENFSVSSGKERVLARLVFLNEAAWHWPLLGLCIGLLEPVGSCWHPVNRPGPLRVPNQQWHKNNMHNLFLCARNISTKGYETTDYLPNSNSSVINTQFSISTEVFWPQRKMYMEIMKTIPAAAQFCWNTTKISFKMLHFESNFSV